MDLWNPALSLLSRALVYTPSHLVQGMNMRNIVKDRLFPADRHRHGVTPRRRGYLLRAGVVVAGAALVLTSLDGVTFAAGQGAAARDHSAASVLMARDVAGAGVSVAAKPENPGRGNGNGNLGNGNRGRGQLESQGNDNHPGNGVGLGLLVNGGLDDGQADALANELASEFDGCLTTDEVEDMRLGQIKRLAHAAGLSTEDLKDLLAEDADSDNGHGLGQLVGDGLNDNQAEDLADALNEGIEDRLDDGEDLNRIKLGHLLQAAHACGITTEEIKDMLRDAE